MVAQIDDSENACLNGERAGQTQLTIPQQNAINDMEEVQKSVDTEHVPANPTHYEGPPIWKAFVKNWPIISQPLALLMICILLWAILYSVITDFVSADSKLMRFVYLFVGAQISGILVTFIHLPDMLGMLFWGVFFTNIGLSNFKGYERLESFLRDMALINIMLLAGLGLEVKVFKKLLGMVVRLSIIPTVAETVIVAVLAHFLLQMPWLWGLLLGLVITAISPNVVVTVMLRLKELKLGLNNGIHTVIYATTTFNDVIAIFIFGVILGTVFSKGSTTEQLLVGPVGMGIGIVFGFLYGLLLANFPSRKAKYADGLRFVLVLLGGTISVVGSKYIEYPTAGALGCVTVAFFVRLGLHRKKMDRESSVLSSRLDLLWRFIKPISFSLIGKELNFGVLDPKVVGIGTVVILCGCLFRLVSSYLSTYGGGLTWKERAYITISGLPKATIQAALGPMALDLARSLNSIENLELANNVLVVSVLAIIFTAPLGAVLMIRLAPVWLQGTEPQTDSQMIIPDSGRGRAMGRDAEYPILVGINTITTTPTINEPTETQTSTTAR